jgi:hypothetical protein
MVVEKTPGQGLDEIVGVERRRLDALEVGLGVYPMRRR